MVQSFSHFQSRCSLFDEDNKLRESDAIFFSRLILWDHSSLNKNSHTSVQSCLSSECEGYSCFLFCLRCSPILSFSLSQAAEALVLSCCLNLVQQRTLSGTVLQTFEQTVKQMIILRKKKKKRKKPFETETNRGSPKRLEWLCIGGNNIYHSVLA